MKSVDPAPGQSEARLRQFGARYCCELEQRDTFFDVAGYYLKLREEHPGRPHLIRYERSRRSEGRESSYAISYLDDPERVKSRLAARFGIRGTVSKRRHLLLYRNARIHLDQVEGLGRFIEIEVVAEGPRSTRSDRELLALIASSLGIVDEHVVGVPYLELVSAACARVDGRAISA